MNLSRTAWHYRVVQKFHGSVANNLCPYMWQVVGGLLTFPAIGFGISLLAVFLSYPIWQFFFELPLQWAPLFTVFSVVLWLLVGGAGFAYYRDYRRWVVEPIYDLDIPFPAAPSIWGVWARAAHDRVCPLLTFTDE